MLKAGDKAPDFSFEVIESTDKGRRVSLKDFRDQTLVLYFYPRDSTPGCTREAQAFSAARSAIERAGGAVIGVSRDTTKSHCSFRDKYKLTIPLASDPELTAHKAYGAWGEKNMYGKKILGTIRSTFLVKDGRVVRVWPSVKVDGHADAVLAAIGELSGGGTKPAAKKAAAKAPAKKAPATKAPAKKLSSKAAAPKATAKKAGAKKTAKKKTKA